MDIVKVLREKSSIIERALPSYLPPIRGCAEMRQYRAALWDYFKRGGKRLRPALCLLTAEALGLDGRKALPFAIALEIAHNFLLIHDDIEDESEFRRGRPCLHHIYGLPLAIAAGDELNILAFNAALRARRLLGDAIALQGVEKLVQILSIVSDGQAMELGWVRRGVLALRERDYFEMAVRKSAWYTTIGPCHLGAIAAGRSDLLDSITAFGRPFGVAFQIQDDVLNLTAGKEYGKEIGGDILEGKRTFILIHLLKHATKDERRRLEAIYRLPRSSKRREDVDWVLEAMRRHGSIEYASNYAHKLAKRARALFERAFADVEENEGKESIRALIDFVVERRL